MVPPRAGRPPLALLLGFGVFLVVIAGLLATSLVRRNVTTFVPSVRDPARPRPDTLIEDTLTIDARDPARWQFVDLARGAVVAPPDTAGWDLAVRRFTVVPAGAAADLGPRAFDAVTAAPDTGYVPTRFGRDTANPATARWYRYSFLSHLLEPAGHVYVLRMPDGQYAKLTVLSYYCPGLQAGCVTLRYAIRVGGSRAFR